MVVDQIHWGQHGVTVHCQDKKQLKADAVIVTVSLGVLKVLPRLCYMMSPVSSNV